MQGVLRIRAALPVVLTVVLVACEPGGGAASSGQDEHQDQLERLAALGYAEFAADAAVGGSGVVLHERELSRGGYDLYTSIPDGLAVLLDPEGTELRTWTAPFDEVGMRWSRAGLLAGGDLLVVGSYGPDSLERHPFAMRLDWDGKLLWRRDIDAHHDFEVQPDGTIAVLTKSLRKDRALHASLAFRDNEITLLDADGNTLWSKSLYEILRTAPKLFRWRPASLIKEIAPGQLDPIHCNKITWIRAPELAAENPLYAATNVLLTIRHQDMIAIVDLEAGRLLWTWGQGLLQGPHEATLLPDGNILLLDNGRERRGWSRVVEMDPRTGQIVWKYTAPRRREFFTPGRGTVQALGGGNVLVSNSNSGEAFEITRSGELVWRFLTPRLDPEGHRAVLRLRRYEATFLEPLLAR